MSPGFFMFVLLGRKTSDLYSSGIPGPLSVLNFYLFRHDAPHFTLLYNAIDRFVII